MGADNESFFRVVADTGEPEGFAKNVIEGAGNLGFESRERFVVVWSKETIIGDDEHFIGAKAQAGAQPGIVFKQAAALHSGFYDFGEGLDWLLAVVKETYSIVGPLYTEVALMRDEQNTRSIVNVTVIVDVDQKMVFNGLLLNPFMENGNEFRGLNPFAGNVEKFNPQPIQVHYGVAFPT
ncbi:MAG: hypothetical protein DMG16_08920 [Acidobacteria bacterium]|nr:MAG: hypothetical protein DMG16_08920 [Acidobacteriota bacterium]